MHTEIGYIYGGHVFPHAQHWAKCKRCGRSLGAHMEIPAYCVVARAYLAPGANRAELWRQEQDKSQRRGSCA